jgi:cobalamin synthase
MTMFGLIDIVASVFAPLSPLRLFGFLFGVEINERILAASAIAVPANFGSTAAGSAVQVYINRRVPLASQGATFGLQEVQENALTLVAVIVLGVLATVIGPQLVFLIAPIAVIGVVIYLIDRSFRALNGGQVSAREALSMMADQSGDQIR